MKRLRGAAWLAVFVLLTFTPWHRGAAGPEHAVEATAPAGGDQPDMYIEVRHGHVSMRLHQAPWDRVLRELVRQTGITIEVDGHLAGTVSQAFDALPLEQGLHRLFHEMNRLFLYAPMRQGEAQPAVDRIWLVSHDATGGTTTVSGHQEAPHLTALEAFARQGDTEALQQALLDPDESVRTDARDLLAGWGRQRVTDTLIRATMDEQPVLRERALSLLHTGDEGDDRTVLSALETALTDPDITVKNYAIHALAERGGVDAMGALRQALHDPDLSIRRVVIENVAPKAQGRALLQEALSNDDPEIRGLAAFWLEETAVKEP